MPYKDPEEKKKAQRELMRQRRAQAKEKAGEVTAPAESGVTSSPEPLKVSPKTKKASPVSPKPAPATRKDKPKAEAPARHGPSTAPQGLGAGAESSPHIPPPEARHPMSGKYYDETGNPTLDNPRIPSTALENPQSRAEEVAARTRESLDTRGWCLWKCSLFNGDTVLIVRDETVTDYPPGYPIYLEDELKHLPESDLSLKYIHRIKKTALVHILPGFESAMTQSHAH